MNVLSDWSPSSDSFSLLATFWSLSWMITSDSSVLLTCAILYAHSPCSFSNAIPLTSPLYSFCAISIAFSGVVWISLSAIEGLFEFASSSVDVFSSFCSV